MTVSSRTVPPPGRTASQGLVALGLLAIFVALGGVYWDVAWHGTVGRESFWIPPHLLVYSGVNVFLLAALAGLGLAWQRAGSLRSALDTSAGIGFAVAAAGPLVQLGAAPLDDLWHRLYGLDVTIWSPPHLMGLAGGMVGVYGLLTVLGATPPRDGRPLWRGASAGEALCVLLFGAALALSMFALGEFDSHLDERDALFYPMLAGVLAAVPLMAAPRYLGRPGAATAAALVYTLFRVAILPVIWTMGSAGHLTPPVLVLAPTIIIDLVLWRTGGRSVLAAATLTGPALVAGEWASLAVFGKVAWDPLEVAASLAAVTLVAAAGALAGDRLQKSMSSTDNT